MINFKFLISSIFFSVLFHFSIIFFFNSKKEDNEIFVVNLSEFKEFSIAKPPPSKPKTVEKALVEKPKQPIKKKEIKKEIKKKILKNEDTISLNKKDVKKELINPKKIVEINPETEKKQKVLEKTKKVNNTPNQISTKPIKKMQSLKKTNSTIVDKMLSDYLNFISLEINKMASKSYPIQSIKRREQGTITSVLIIDKNGRLVEIEIKNKAPRRLYKSTMKILKAFKFPEPPEEILNSKGFLRIKIPVNYILK